MVQALTPDLTAILKAKFQAGASGFRGRLEVGVPLEPVPLGGVTVVQTAFANLNTATFALPVTEGNTIIALVSSRSPTGGNNISGFSGVGYAALTIPTDNRASYISRYVVLADTSLLSFGGNSRTFGSGRVDDRVALIEAEGELDVLVAPVTQPNHAASTTMDCGGPIVPRAGIPALVVGAGAYGPKSYVTYPQVTVFADVTELADANNGPHLWGGYRHVADPDGVATYSVGGTLSAAHAFSGVTAVFVPIDADDPATAERLSWVPYQVRSLAIDKSLRVVADQATVELANDLSLGWGAESVFRTNTRCRIFQWYGDEANAVQTFLGLIDKVHDHRDPASTSLAIRDLMAILIDQTFSASAPQAATEAGAVRTAANGVYLSMEVSDILGDILDRAGWPVADRAITVTSYVLDEFIVADGASWASTIIGKERLTGLVGYSAWADEFGVFHFAPTSVSQNLTEPVVPVYTFQSGVDAVSLDDETDQYDLRTRIKVRGPLTTQTLRDTWRELWRTKKFARPVGLWHDPADPGNLRVLDRGTKRLYKLRQSDRKVLSSVNLGAVISHPLGLSGDPADATVYWVLDAPWIYTGSTSGNSVKKVRKSDNHVLATYAIPNGRWSALKVSAAYLWLTNLDTDRFYKRDKTDGSAIANYQHTYNSVTQANPSGMMVDGTTLYLFWSNGGTTARFLVADEAAPGTVTDVVKTAGTNLHGGEMDTVTHTECYGDSDSLGLVAKFTLVAVVSQTTEVFAEVVDSDLEDELGFFAVLEPREHDTHTGDADHPFEVRRETLDLRVITSLAQATETAQRQLDLASVRRRVVDLGVIGNPALQKTDPVELLDPVTGIADAFVIDTYRTLMDGAGTYLGTLALLPVDALDDDPDDDGDAT